MTASDRDPVSLADVTATHAALVARWLSNPMINQWLYSEWRGQKFDEKIIYAMTLNPRNRLWIILLHGEPYGLMALQAINTFDKNAMIWCVRGEINDVRKCLKNRQGAGTRNVMEEAVRKVARAAFDTLSLQSLQASTMKNNTRVSRILEAVGFVHAGVYRKSFRNGNQFIDRLLYDLLPEDLEYAGEMSVSAEC